MIFTLLPLERVLAPMVMPAPNIPPSPSQYTVLVFLKSLAAPIVLFSDNPMSLYEEIKRHIQQASPQAPKLIEKPGVGPLKKVSFIDTEISGVALQADPQGLR